MHELRSSLIRGEQRGPLASKSRGQGSGSPAPSGGEKPAEGSLAGIRIKRQEARRCDQRREPRHPNVVEKAILAWQRQNTPVDVLNVSARGVMIETALELNIGDRVAIRFSDCNPTDCVVRWLKGGRAGLEFVRETLVIGASAAHGLPVGGRREGEQPTIAVKGTRAPRQGLMMNAEIHTVNGSMPVRLRNISKDGAMLEAAKDLEPWTEVVLDLHGQAVSARVRWCRAHQIGIAFDNSVDLDALLHAPPPEKAAPVPGYLKPAYLEKEVGVSRRLRPEDL